MPIMCFSSIFTTSTSGPLTARQQNIPFTILERDKNADMREQGWAITLHWALPLLQDVLPQELMAKLQKCQVNAEVAENDTQDFKLINLEDCSEIFNTPSGERWRVNRSKMRLALLDGLDDSIRWNQHVKSVELRKGFAQVRCEDGRLHFADIIIGADGSNSAIRRFLCLGKHAVTPLPYRMLGVGTKLTELHLVRSHFTSPRFTSLDVLTFVMSLLSGLKNLHMMNFRMTNLCCLKPLWLLCYSQNWLLY